MTVNQRVRFDVFKRDGFTCQYCGRKPPEVVLHVDHIEPRSAGGPDSYGNFVTSCSTCNLGKGPRPLFGPCGACLFCGVEGEHRFEIPHRDATIRATENETVFVCHGCVDGAVTALFYTLFVNDWVCAGCGVLCKRHINAETSFFPGEPMVVCGDFPHLCPSCFADAFPREVFAE